MLKPTPIDLDTIHRLYDRVLQQFPTDVDCLNILVQLLIGIVLCNECGSQDLGRTGNDRHAQCLHCNKITWLTARTFISGIKKPRAHLMALIYRGQGIAISAAELARVVGIANSTAQCILKKIDGAVASLMTPSGISVESRHFFECIFKRSTHTPTKEHPVAEFDELDKQNASLKKRAKRLRLPPDENAVYKLLSDQPTTIDELSNTSGLPINRVAAALTMLELGNLTKLCPGNKFVKCLPLPRSARKINKRTKRFLECHVEQIRTTYQGISRRYLQHYLAFCWTITDRTKWNLKALLAACAKFGPITFAQIAAYVSPPVVLLAPIA